MSPECLGQLLRAASHALRPAPLQSPGMGGFEAQILTETDSQTRLTNALPGQSIHSKDKTRPFALSSVLTVLEL